jgi:hypothetical protein
MLFILCCNGWGGTFSDLGDGSAGIDTPDSFRLPARKNSCLKVERRRAGLGFVFSKSLSTRTGDINGTGCDIGAETVRLSRVGAASNGFAARGVMSDDIRNLEGSFWIINGTVGAADVFCLTDRNGKTGNCSAVLLTRSFKGRLVEFVRNGLVRSYELADVSSSSASANIS